MILRASRTWSLPRCDATTVVTMMITSTMADVDAAEIGSTTAAVATAGGDSADATSFGDASVIASSGEKTKACAGA